MCGRFYLDAKKDKLQAHYQLKQVPDLLARYNIAPTQNIAAIRQGEAGPELVMLHWGLIPAWAKEEKTHYSMINARAESVDDKPAYRSAFRHRRCLIPVSGFYEWAMAGKQKQPYVIRMKDTEVFSLAGLWEHWEGEDGKVIESCTIIVTDANNTLRPIHDRMPVIIQVPDYQTWLDPANVQQSDLQSLLVPYSLDNLYTYPVSLRVNSPKNDDPACLEAWSQAN